MDLKQCDKVHHNMRNMEDELKHDCKFKRKNSPAHQQLIRV